MITVLGVCHLAVELDVSPGPSGVGCHVPNASFEGAKGGKYWEKLG